MKSTMARNVSLISGKCSGASFSCNPSVIMTRIRILNAGFHRQTGPAGRPEDGMPVLVIGSVL
ncbi:MAG: hypothetical protein ACREVH_01510 [Gammaproteobacteria bacterium]